MLSCSNYCFQKRSLDKCGFFLNLNVAEVQEGQLPNEKKKIILSSKEFSHFIFQVKVFLKWFRGVTVGFNDELFLWCPISLCGAACFYQDFVKLHFLKWRYGIHRQAWNPMLRPHPLLNSKLIMTATAG